MGTPMKRHASLHPLSEHHHHALVCALQMRRAGQAPPAERVPRARKAAENFLRFWSATGSRHFREEEEFVLPAYSRHKPLDEDADVMAMLAEHAAIRARVVALEQARGDDRATEAIIGELGSLLHRHVRREEDLIFPAIERALSEEELTWLGERLSRLHGKK
jgi:hemerythrin-like domain-containing protein